MRKLLNRLFKKDFVWTYGYIPNRHSNLRRHRITGEVRFILWKAGEQGHEEDFWCKMDRSWWNLFVPYPRFEIVRYFEEWSTDPEYAIKKNGKYIMSEDLVFTLRTKTAAQVYVNQELKRLQETV